jgi:hypothetical protein
MVTPPQPGQMDEFGTTSFVSAKSCAICPFMQVSAAD